MNVTEPLELLGRHIDEPVVRHFLQQTGGSYERQLPDEECPDHRYVTSDDSGLELSTDPHGFVHVVFLYLYGHQSKPAYTGALPLGLQPSTTQLEARSILGDPQFARPPRQDAVLGRYGPIDRYDYPEYSVHLEYAEASSMFLLITLMVPSAIPDRERPH